MENKSHTQQQFNDFIEKIRANLNYIYIILMIVVNVLLSTLTIENGNIGLRYPDTALGWVLWALQILIQTVVGVLILNAFRRQGISLGHKQISETYTKYLEVTKRDKGQKPRSMREYLGKEALKDSIKKSIVLIILGSFVGSVVIGANLNNLLSLGMNIIFSICFGIKALMDAEEYVVTELVVWYQLRIEELTCQDQEPSKEIINGNIQGNISELGSTEPSRIQQEKECTTRPKTIKSRE